MRADYPEHMFSAGAWGQDGSIYLDGRVDSPDNARTEYGLFRVSSVGAEAKFVFTADRGNWWIHLAVDRKGNLAARG